MTRDVRRAVWQVGLAALMLAVGLAPATSDEQTAERVVSIGGSITEIVYALGAQDRLAAVDSTSRYPREALGLPNVGYMRQLAAEPILALEPTLVLVEEDAGPPAVLDQLREAGVNLVVVSDGPSPEGVLEKVAVVARALGVDTEGQELSERLEGDFAQLGAALADVGSRPKVLFLLSIGDGAPLAAGSTTSAAGIIALAGGRNAADGFDGYKPLTPEAAATAAPDVILVTARTLDALGGEASVLSRPEIAATPAGRDGRLVAMDGLLLLGFGPRTPDAIRELAGALHPGLQLPAAGD